MRTRVIISLLSGVAIVAGCTRVRPVQVLSSSVDCNAARMSAIETLRILGYAIVGSYDPMPGRMTIIAAEKTTPKATFQSNVTITCDEDRVEVKPAQPAIAWHDPHFEEDFRTAFQERTGGVVRQGLVRRDTIGGTQAPGPGTPRTTSSSMSPEDSVPTRSPTEGLSIHLDLFPDPEARKRFGSDLAAAGLVAVRLTITNRMSRPYIVSTPLLKLRRASGEVVPPLSWSEASARIAKSDTGQGWRAYDELSRQLVSDQILESDATLNGILLYPAGEYTAAELLLIDQKSARSERFEGALPPTR